MSSRLDKNRESELQPQRIEGCKRVLIELGFVIILETNTELRFLYNGNTISLFPYSGWFSGKGIKQGRGFKELLKQIKN